ncbi:hypothetical protein [Actibacterium sp. 188UL27-1]|uniref:hypothetical protein n=1 Tax=Actibacterium sp. 188UL27-1 TaxID=2786961 RepID=UPI00195C17A4|nr:hypothetical protein [Actibacterium sp. 188UL27-1]MBM7069610.1 hypothetical protein [Actibacterium sp. 188UL27-1]
MPDPYKETCDSADAAGFETDSGGTSVVESCPLAGGTSAPNIDPCYTEKVEIGSKTGRQSVTWEHAKRHERIASEQRKILGGADLVLQVIADEKTPRAGGKPLDLYVNAVTTPICPKSDHPSLQWSGGDLTNPVSWCEPTTFETTVRSKGTSGAADSFFDTYWPFGKRGCSTYYVNVASCGIPLDKTESAPALVTGRVEAYRKSDVELSIVLPALKGKSAHRSKHYDVTRRTTTATRSETSSNDFGRQQTGSSASHSQSRYNGTDKWDYSTTRSHGRGMVVTTAHSSGTEGFARVDETEKGTMIIGSGFRYRRKVEVTGTDHGVKIEAQDIKPTGVTLTHNGKDVANGAKYLKALLTLPQTIQSFIGAFKDSVPKIGWQADASVSVIQGTFIAGWKLAPKDDADHDRLWLIDRRFNFDIKCTLVKIEISIGFGIEWVVANPLWKPPLVELIFVVKMSIDFTADMTLQLRQSQKESFEAKAAVASVPKIKAEAKAMINGCGVSASCEISTGIEGEFTFKGGIKATPELKGKLGFKPIAVTVELDPPVGGKIKEELFKYPKKTTPIWEADLLTSKAK